MSRELVERRHARSLVFEILRRRGADEDTFIEIAMGLGSGCLPTVATLPLDALTRPDASDGEAMREAAAKVCDDQREYAMDNLRIKHRPAHYAGYREAAIELAIMIRALPLPQPIDTSGIAYTPKPAAPAGDVRVITTDPMEQLIERALIDAGIRYETDHGGGNPSRLDFRLPDFDVEIEVKRFHTDRVAAQMARASNVIVAQGEPAVRFLANALRAAAPSAPKAERDSAGENA